jgi:hypothetical protein
MGPLLLLETVVSNPGCFLSLWANTILHEQQLNHRATHGPLSAANSSGVKPLRILTNSSLNIRELVIIDIT